MCFIHTHLHCDCELIDIPDNTRTCVSLVSSYTSYVL